MHLHTCAALRLHSAGKPQVQRRRTSPGDAAGDGGESKLNFFPFVVEGFPQFQFMLTRPAPMPWMMGASLCSSRCLLPLKSIQWPDLAAFVSR